MNHSELNQDYSQPAEEIPITTVVMKAWAQQLLLRASSQPPMQLPDDEEHVGTPLYNAVARIRRSAPPLQAEAELRRILVGEIGGLYRDVGSVEFWNEAKKLVNELMTCYRLLGRPALTMGKLTDMRKAAWERWWAAVHEQGVDPDQKPDPSDETPMDDRTFDRLLRLGPAAVAMNGMEAIQFIAWFLFISGQLSAWEKPVDAIEDIIAWARCAWPLRQGEAQAIRQVCNNAWNFMLPMAPPTVAMIHTVMAIEPCTGNQPPKKPSGKKRIGLLRLFQRLSSQRDFWQTLGEVELPTDWLTDAKDSGDSKSIIGFSANTYGPMLRRLAMADILVPIREPNRGAHQCTRYEYALTCGDDPAVDDAIVAYAEDLVSTNPDHVIEEVIAAVEKAATAEAQEAEQPTA